MRRLQSLLQSTYAFAHRFDFFVELFGIREDESIDRSGQYTRSLGCARRQADVPAALTTRQCALGAYLCTPTLAAGLAREYAVALQQDKNGFQNICALDAP